MKLEQGQIWKTDPEVHTHDGKPLYLRIVQLERLSVDYKEMADPNSADGYHKKTTKKQFCRMLKRAELLGD